MLRVGIRSLQPSPPSCQQISCPGVRLSWLNSRVYLKIKMFGCLAISSKLKPKFPLILFEHFYFDKQFECENTSQLFDSLSGEHKLNITFLF